jgi:ubiquinone/menaquinone biosynthesis C-methylase UbiE
MIYRMFIDPLLYSAHWRAASLAGDAQNVLDVACGTGALTLMIEKKTGGKVTGIDIDPQIFIQTERKLKRKGLQNPEFIIMDATNLSCFREKEFDVAVISLALHQFSPSAGLKVLNEMKRVAQRVIIIDYACPMSLKIFRWLTWLIERLAGGDHYRNFKKYMKRGGLDSFLNKSGMLVKERYIQGKGTLMVCLCEY